MGLWGNLGWNYLCLWIWSSLGVLKTYSLCDVLALNPRKSAWEAVASKALPDGIYICKSVRDTGNKGVFDNFTNVYTNVVFLNDVYTKHGYNNNV